MGRAASGELARLQIRVVLVPMPPGCRTGNPGSTPGLSAHIEPSARAHQAEGAGCISPPAALAAVGLPGCRRAGGQSMKHSPSILQRGRLSRPCRRRSLSAAALRGRRRIRHPSCKPDWVRRARTGRQPAAAPLRAASGGRRDPHNSIGCHTGCVIAPDPEPQKHPPTTALCWNLSFWSSSQSGILHPLICDPPDTGPSGVFLPGVKSWTSNQVSSRCSCCSPFP